MRLIPPEGASISEVEKAPLTLVWSPDSHPDEYILHLPIVTDFEKTDVMIPDRYAEFLSEDLVNDTNRWLVSNRVTHVEISTLPAGDHDHEQVIEAAHRLLQFIQLPEPAVIAQI